MTKQHLERSHCGLRIADCGLNESADANPKSEIRNPKFFAAGFTLIELMIVVVILGVLATMVMPKILDKPEQARRTKAKVDIRSIQSALAMFKTDTGRFPTTAEGLQALVANPGPPQLQQGRLPGARAGGPLGQQVHLPQSRGPQQGL